MEKDGDAPVPATTIHPGFGRHDPACVYAVQNLEGRMPDDQWKVLYRAASLAQHNGGIFYCSRDYLAKESGVSRSTAVRALAWAADHGVLEQVPDDARSEHAAKSKAPSRVFTASQAWNWTRMPPPRVPSRRAQAGVAVAVVVATTPAPTDARTA